MAAFTYTAPTVGGSSDTWGTTLNQNWSNLSTFLGTLDSADLAVLDGLTASTAELNLLDGVTATTAELNILDGVTATTAELNYTDGVTSAIQPQLDAKAADTTQSTATWQAGTSTTESIVSPAKVKAAVLANTSGYTPPTAAGAVGTYATAMYLSTVSFGGTYAGSSLYVASTANSFTQSVGGESFSGGASGTLSGTWRAMTRGTAVSNRYPTGTFLRIS